MTDGHRRTEDEDIEAALLDAELFLKYQAPQRAISKLREAVERNPRSVRLREKLRELAATYKRPDEAARQCLALANLYIAREDFDQAQDRLLDAKQFDPRISIASGLEAIRRARRPDLAHGATDATLASAESQSRTVTLAGDLSVVSIFDAAQVVENARLTGALSITSGERFGRVLFNEGRIVGAEMEDKQAEEAFRLVVEVTDGAFDFERAAQPFPVTINAPSNTNLILDTLRQMDEDNQ